jgi:uncharacterized protein YnzC (UPF0291/DUF896 family)
MAMELKEVIARLNTLYHWSQQAELTAEQSEERDRLRRIYLDAMKQQVQSSLERIEIVDQDSTATEKPHRHDCDCGCRH